MDTGMGDLWRRAVPGSTRGRVALALGGLAWLPAGMVVLPLFSVLAGMFWLALVGNLGMGVGSDAAALAGAATFFLGWLVEVYGGAGALLAAAPGGAVLALAWYATRRGGESAIAWGLALATVPALLMLVPLTLLQLTSLGVPAALAAPFCFLAGFVCAGPAAMWSAARHMQKVAKPVREAALWNAAAGVIVLTLLYAVTSTDLGAPEFAEALASLYVGSWRGL